MIVEISAPHGADNQGLHKAAEIAIKKQFAKGLTLKPITKQAASQYLQVDPVWGNPDRIRSGVRLGHPFEAWIYTTTHTTVLPDYYYYPGFYRFGYFRGGVSRHHHHFYSFGLYSYPFDPYPYIVSYEAPYKIVYFEGDRCTGWEYLNY